MLPQIVASYNNTKHSQLCNKKYSPNEVRLENIQEIYDFLYGTGKNSSRPHVKKREPKFRLGQTVVISVNDIDKFRKGYENRYQYEFFKITKVDTKDQIPMYTLATLDGTETIRGEREKRTAARARDMQIIFKTCAFFLFQVGSTVSKFSIYPRSLKR